MWNTTRRRDVHQRSVVTSRAATRVGRWRRRSAGWRGTVVQAPPGVGGAATLRRRTARRVARRVARHDEGMPIQLNHTVVAARDAEAAARWFAELFGVEEPE